MAASSWKWHKFNPQVKQTDKREREGVVIKARKMVQKNFNKLGLAPSSVFLKFP